jgi:hypothetical protein
LLGAVIRFYRWTAHSPPATAHGWRLVFCHVWCTLPVAGTFCHGSLLMRPTVVSVTRVGISSSVGCFPTRFFVLPLRIHTAVGYGACDVFISGFPSSGSVGGWATVSSSRNTRTFGSAALLAHCFPHYPTAALCRARAACLPTLPLTCAHPAHLLHHRTPTCATCRMPDGGSFGQVDK